MAKTGAERQKEYEKRKIDAGFKRVPIWVPADKAEELRAFAETLQK